MVEIDKHKIYRSHDYLFKNFIMMSDDEKRMVLKWRNDDSVRQWMYSAKQATEVEHFNYIRTLEGRDDRWYWIIYRKELPVGVLVLALQDSEMGMYEPGIYMNPELYGEGFGLFKEIYYMLLFVLGVKICGSTQSDNKNAIYINMFLGVKYAGMKVVSQDGKDVEYMYCPLYTKEDLAPHLDSTIGEFVKFVKKLKNNK